MERPYKRPYKPREEEEKKETSTWKVVFIAVTVMILIAVVIFSIFLYIKKQRDTERKAQETAAQIEPVDWTNGAALQMYESEDTEPDDSRDLADTESSAPDNSTGREEDVKSVETASRTSETRAGRSDVQRRVSPVSKTSDGNENSKGDEQRDTEKKESDSRNTSGTAASSTYEYIMDAKEVKEQRDYVPTIPLICAPEVGCDPMLAQDITNGLLEIPVRNYVELGENGWQFILTLTPCKDRFNLENDMNTHVDYFTQVIYFDNTAKSYGSLFREIGHAVSAMNNYPQMRNEFQDIYEEEGKELGYEPEADDKGVGDFFAEVYEGLIQNPSSMRRICPRASTFVSNYMD